MFTTITNIPATHRHPEDDGVVAPRDRVVRQQAEARPGENLLDDHRAAENLRDLQTRDRHHRDERVPQAVAIEDGAIGEPLRPRARHVILAHHLEHRRAHEAGEVGDGRQREDDHRHDEILDPRREGRLRLPGADRRQPVEFDAQIELQQECQPEVRDGEADKRADRCRVIEEAVLLRGGEDAERDGDEQGNGERNPLQYHRRANPAPDQAEDGLAVEGVGGAEIPAHEPPHVAGVLDR